MTADQAIARARSAIGQSCSYLLGAGGMHPEADVPWGNPPECDCTGFLAWCLGVSRKSTNPFYVEFDGGWISSEAIFRDCATPFGFFDGLGWTEAKPGDVLVFGNRTSGGVTHHGHVGLVATAGKNGPLSVVHCSLGNWRKTGDAIQETGPEVWAINMGRVARTALLSGVPA